MSWQQRWARVANTLYVDTRDHFRLGIVSIEGRRSVNRLHKGCLSRFGGNEGRQCGRRTRLVYLSSKVISSLDFDGFRSCDIGFEIGHLRGCL